jgi:hypothetical protein
MTKLDWPTVADSLFRTGEDWNNEALFSPPLAGYLSYANSYKEAADCLVSSIETGFLKPDLVCYPILYLYHHWLELILKGIILLDCEYKATDCPYEKHEHNVDTLWSKCRPILEETFPEGDKRETDAVERFIKQIASVDRSGELSKYPELQKGGRSFEKPVQLNLRNLREIASRVDCFLSTSYDALDDLNQHGPGAEDY